MPPGAIKTVMIDALSRARDIEDMRSRPGMIMGLFAHAHPVLEGNGRMLMVVHSELAHRAGISIDWPGTDKAHYLAALTAQLRDPYAAVALDDYLKPFVGPAVGRGGHETLLQRVRGLDGGQAG